MKNIYLALGVIFLIQLFSCDEPEEETKVVYYEFLLDNQSDYPVTLHLYKQDGTIYNSIFIDSNQTQLIDKGNNYFPTHSPDFYLTDRLDSGEFIFKDGKKLIQTNFEKGNTDSINNVLFIGDYKILEQSDKIRKLLFTLTKADYLRAK